MTATLVARDTPRKEHILSIEDERPMTADGVILAGTIVCLAADGYATAGAGAVTTLKALGRAKFSKDNTGGDDGDLFIKYSEGVFRWENSAPGADEIAQGDVGEICWIADNQTVAKTSATDTRSPAGVIMYVDDDGVWVAMGLHITAMLAQSVDVTNVENDITALQAGIVQKRTVTVGHADLTDADTSQDILIGATLPANARILGTDIRAMTAFAGGTVSALTVDIGTSGDVDALVDGADLATAAVDGGPATMPLGVRHNKTFVTIGAQLSARFISVGDNLINLTSGSAIIDVLFVVLA